MMDDMGQYVKVHLKQNTLLNMVDEALDSMPEMEAYGLAQLLHKKAEARMTRIQQDQIHQAVDL